MTLFSNADVATLRVTVLAPFFRPAYRGGGPIQTLSALLQAAPDYVESRVICLNADLGAKKPLIEESDQWLPVNGSMVWYSTPTVRRVLNAQRTAAHEHPPDLVYLNSFFDPKFSVLPQLLRRAGFWKNATFVLAPRGELEIGALSSKTAKKRTYIRAYRALRIHRTVIWHASNEEEAASIRRTFGHRTQIVVREDETSLPNSAFSRGVRDPGPCRFVFVGRLVEHKGLHLLLEAMRSVEEPTSFDIFGSFQDSAYETECRKLLERLPTNVAVTLHGAVDQETALRAYRAADVTLLPTRSENFGHVIAEALSQSSPVFCGPDTPWSKTLMNGGGRVVETRTAESWAIVLREFLQQGEKGWARASRNAADAYVRWRNEEKGAHLFDLVQQIRPVAR